MGQLAIGNNYQSKMSKFMRVGGSAIPAIVPSSGTVATAGVVTLTTALPQIYANAWIYLPAGAVVGGAAGMYYTVFSSTTVGQVYTEYQAAATTPFVPYIPATLVAAVGSNAGYTQTTASDLTVYNVTVPGGLIGVDGEIDLDMTGSTLNNANAKTLKATFGSMILLTASVASVLSFNVARKVANRGKKTSQVSQALAALGKGATSATANIIGTEDTNADVAFKITIQLATATDYVVFDDMDLNGTDS